MGGDGGEDGGASQSAIPLIAGAIVLAQVTMVRYATSLFFFLVRSVLVV